MLYHISLYSSLAIFLIGLLYKAGRWLSVKPSVEARAIATAQRLSSALKGILLTVVSVKLVTLIKVFFLDILLQRKVLREDVLRWLAHMLIYGAFMLLLLMHALDTLTTARLFDSYASTVNPFLFLRELFGALVIVGVALAVYRRFILKVPRLTSSPMDIYAIVLVAVIVLSGILLEGAKIGSYSRYQQMVTDYAGLEETEEDFKALTAFWVTHFGTVAPGLKEPFDSELLTAGEELHEMSCAGCHSRPQWAFMGSAVASAIRGAALPLDRAAIPTLLSYIHFLACFIGLAYLPFSKLFHLITSPLSLLANSVMDLESDPVNIQTRQALELDACMHCGTCTAHCSVAVVFEQRGNVSILPSEKMQALKRVLGAGKGDRKERRLLLEGTYWCTNCHRCTEVCPAGINLEELWFSAREALFDTDSPECSVLSPLSFYRGLMRERIAEDAYLRPLDRAREALAEDCELLKDESRRIALSPEAAPLLVSDQAASFRACFGCQTCTNVCPVVAAYEAPKEALGMLPHQIMYAVGLGIKDLAFGSTMLWHCVTCYQCQEHCPQGVKVTEVLYELKNLAVSALGETGNRL